MVLVVQFSVRGSSSLVLLPVFERRCCFTRGVRSHAVCLCGVVLRDMVVFCFGWWLCDFCFFLRTCLQLRARLRVGFDET